MSAGHDAARNEHDRQARRRGRISVLAGVNGAGKSSVVGAAVRAAGGEYFNPDEATQRVLELNPAVDLSAANAAAWAQGRRLLERAIAERLDFAFETTLGGNTIAALLFEALDAGLAVHMRYVGLDGPELHLARVRARVAAGGHDIPEHKVRERYESSRRNLIALLPRLTELEVFDNSVEAPPQGGLRPVPRLLLHTAAGAVGYVAPLAAIPGWAKPVAMAALRVAQRGG